MAGWQHLLKCPTFRLLVLSAVSECLYSKPSGSARSDDTSYDVTPLPVLAGEADGKVMMLSLAFPLHR